MQDSVNIELLYLINKDDPCLNFKQSEPWHMIKD